MDFLGYKIGRWIQKAKLHTVDLLAATPLPKIRQVCMFAGNNLAKAPISRCGSGFTVRPDGFDIEMLGNVNQTIKMVAVGVCEHQCIDRPNFFAQQKRR